MSRTATIIREARATAGLTTDLMARLLGCGPEAVEAHESGRAAVETELVERYARIFGLNVRDFLACEFERSPAALLFRSMSASVPSLEDLAATGAHETLGEFLRCVRDLGELEDLLGEAPAPDWLDKVAPAPVGDVEDPPHGAPELAQRAREYLGLGDLEPIPSMVKLLEERFHIKLFFVDPELLDPEIDGASTLNPRPAILVNLIAGGAKWWRTRMTLAHELCHLLFDRQALAQPRRRFFLFSPYRRSEDGTRSRLWHLPDDFERMERRANAFAAYFLAPPEGVRNLVAKQWPASGEAVRRVCNGYQVGRQTAINLLTNIYELTPQERRDMQDQGDWDPLPAQHPDFCVAGTGFRDTSFVARVMRAFAADRIDELEARQYLRIALSEPLPYHPEVPASRCQPLRTLADRARDQAERYVNERLDDPSYYAASIQQIGDEWQVEFRRRTPESIDRHVGILRLTPAFHAVEPVSWLPTSGSRRRRS